MSGGGKTNKQESKVANDAEAFKRETWFLSKRRKVNIEHEKAASNRDVMGGQPEMDNVVRESDGRREERSEMDERKVRLI